MKTILLNASEIPHFFIANDRLLNLVVVYENNCNQNITIPSDIRLDMPGQDAFSMEGFHIEKDSVTKLQFNLEYDYLNSSGPVTLNSYNKKLEEYNYSLGFIAEKKGLYKFRLRYFNEWKHYYSNWIYLTIR